VRRPGAKEQDIGQTGYYLSVPGQTPRSFWREGVNTLAYPLWEIVCTFGYLWCIFLQIGLFAVA